MSRTEREATGEASEEGTEEGTTVHCEYVAGVRVLELTDGEETEYRFEAPEHTEVTFADPDMAELYADVYFDVNGFREAGTGEIGVPPEVVQAGKDTLAAYLLTQPHTDELWVASFYGKTTDEMKRYYEWVRQRADEIRAEARRQGVE